MAVEGSLSDIALLGLLEALCSEKKRVTIQLQQDDNLGEIFVDRGDIIHAATGDLRGELAFYRLLSWDYGSFRAEVSAGLPPTTIGKALPSVMRDAAFRLGELLDPGFIEGERPPSKSESNLDRVLETDLLALLTDAERPMNQLRARRNRRRPTQALRILEDLVNQILDGAQTIPRAGMKLVSLMAVLEEANAQQPMLRLAFAMDKQLSLKTAINLYDIWADGDADRRHTFRQLSRGMVLVLEIFFRRFEAYFLSPRVAAGWRETYHVFLLELTKELDEVEF